MGLCSSPPPPPPPPPDYTGARNSHVADINAQYQQQADAYNQQIDTFNNNLTTDYGGQYNDLQSSINNLDWTTFDDSQWDDYENQITTLQNTISGINAPEKPTFQPTGISYGENVAYNVPTLNSINTNYLTSLNNNLSGLTSKLAGFESQYNAEQDRINNFRNTLLSDLSGINYGLSNASIADENMLLNFGGNLAGIQTQLDMFNSPLSTDGGLFPNVSMQLANAQGTLGNLQDQRAAELARIDSFSSNLNDLIRNTSTGFNGLGITDADIEAARSLDSALDAGLLDAQLFNSPISTNFSSQLGILNNLNSQFDNLYAQRQAEEDRIRMAENQYNTNAMALANSLSGAGYTSRAALDAMQNQINSGLSNLNNFDTVLSYDFGGATDAYNNAQATLDDLFAQRATTLDGFTQRAQELQNSLGGLEAFDEQGMYEIMAQLNQELSGLSPYTGGVVGDVRGNINAARDAVDARLNSLFGERDTIESEAQDLLDQYTNSSFYSTSELADPRAAYDALSGRIDQWGASQAADELAGILARLDQEQNRLQIDEENVERRNNRARADIESLLDANGNLLFDDGTMQRPLTEEEYAELMSYFNKSDNPLEDPTLVNFSRNLGLNIL